MGQPFKTHLAKSPGKGLPSHTVNVVWFFANLVASYLLLLRAGMFDPRKNTQSIPFSLGVLLLSIFCAHHFGKLHGSNHPTELQVP